MSVVSSRLGANVSAAALALALVVTSAAAMWLPNPALAAGGTPKLPLTPPVNTSPFSPGVPQAPVTVPQRTTPPVVTVGAGGTSTSSNGGLSGSSAVAIAIGAMIVLGGISYFIWRDSRRHAHLRPGAGATAAGTVNGASRGSKAPPKPRKLSPAERRRRKRGRARR